MKKLIILKKNMEKWCCFLTSLPSQFDSSESMVCVVVCDVNHDIVKWLDDDYRKQF